jgi:hypothetical protein
MEQHASMSVHLGGRERWLITTLLDLGLITLAQYAATSNDSSVSETSCRNHAARTPPSGLQTGGMPWVDTPDQEP